MSDPRKTPGGRACRSKRRFRDHQQAVRALQTVKARSTRAKVPGRAYHCPHCKGWHLTSIPER